MDTVFSGGNNFKLDVSSLFDEDSNFNENQQPPTEKNSSSCFPNRKPIRYTPTSNDSQSLPGFDLSAGLEWHYPASVELRDYQFIIAERCLYQNCLVCIPTGLGKTLIAAVVLHNFLRWYPEGCVIFMAPTRPLVSQQMMACRDLTGLSTHDKQSGEAIELTGSIPPHQRASLWKGRHRAFFLTPQVIVNDLSSGICPATSIRCIIFDEAHKATGNHAYCQVIRAVTGEPYNHRQFRVVALSATPASDLPGAQAVITNLLISHLEVRTESSSDVRRYCHQRAIETIVVRLDPQLARFKQKLCDLARPPLQRLCEQKALWKSDSSRQPDPEAYAFYTLVKARENFTQNNPYASSIGVVLRDFRIASCFARALQLLTQYGLRPAYQFLSSSIESSTELSQIGGLREYITDLGGVLGTTENPSANMSQLPFVSGHPKLFKLRDVLINHFSNSTASGTRAIIFTQYRDSVADIMHMLKAHSPLLRAAVFVGQSAGDQHSRKRNTQKDQLHIMQAFRDGDVNILISTCIGEEGLDVGQVDLIICFDAHKSPARLIQRLGRTGRKRSGRVVVLLTEGKEQANFSLSMARSNTVHTNLLQGQATKQLVFYSHNPRMIPLGIDPLPKFWQPPICPNTTDIVISKFLASSSKDRAILPATANFSPFKTHPILSLNQKDIQNGDTFTQRYSSNCSIASVREGFQTDTTGPSTTTWNLVASLRLIELHRRGCTHAMYHATGIRKIDMTSPLSEILPASMSQITQSAPEPLSKQPSFMSQRLSDVTRQPSIRFFHGLVSKTLMVDPRIDATEELRLPDVVSMKDVSWETMNKAFEKMVLAAVKSCTQENESATTSNSAVFDSVFGLPAPLTSKTFHPPSTVAEASPAKRRRTLSGSKKETLNFMQSSRDSLVFDKTLRFGDDLDDLLS